jgi:hypothetical protein
MKIQLTRESVAMGDDADAPHAMELTVRDNASVAEIIGIVFQERYLAQIGGGKATWSVISNIPVAVLAQQWTSPKLLMPTAQLSELDFSANTLRIYCAYHTQEDPDLKFEQLQRIRSRNIQR